MTSPATNRRSRPDEIFVRLCDAILSGRYAPGEALPTQRRLAAEFDANLATVREAIGRLEQLHLIEVRHGSAMTVMDWRKHGGVDVIAHALMRAGTLDREMLGHVFEARRLLLTESARLAAERCDPAHARRLTELADGIAAAPDVAAAQQIDFAFFEELIEAAGNLVFVLILNTVRELYLAGAALYREIAADRERLTPLYRAIADAVSDGDGDAAAAATAELARLQQERLAEALA